MADQNRIPEIDAAILIKAVEVLGSKQDAELWLRSSAIGLDGQRPIDMLKSPDGKRLVEEFLFRLEYGVYQ